MKEKKKHCGIRMTAETQIMLRELAEADGRSLGDFLSRLLYPLYVQMKQPKKKD